METIGSKRGNILQYVMYLMLACGTGGVLWYFLRPAKMDIVSNKNISLFLENAIIDAQQDLKSEVTKPDVASRLAWFKSNTNLYKEASHFKDKSIKKESQKLKTLIVKTQQKGFPTLRQAYVASKQEVLKQQDIDITISGEQKDVLILSGSRFEPKKNQQAFLKNIEPIVRDLRFQEVIYRWSDSSDTNEHYQIDAKKDDEV